MKIFLPATHPELALGCDGDLDLHASFDVDDDLLYHLSRGIETDFGWWSAHIS